MSDAHKSWFDKLSHILQCEPDNEQELIELLRHAKDRDILDPDAFSMIEGVLQISKIQVRDIMITRSQMVVIEEAATLSQIMPLIIDSHHSRFPVITETREKVLGILLAKDLLPFSVNPQQFSLATLIRPVMLVPESKRIDILLKEFRKEHNHMAIVADEYGGIAGLITIEDVLEKIVGSIEDEYDIDETDHIKKESANSYTVRGLTPITDFNAFFKTALSDQEFDTIGGLITSKIGRLPTRGETIKLEGFEFRILKMNARRITLLHVTQTHDPV